MPGLSADCCGDLIRPNNPEQLGVGRNRDLKMMLLLLFVSYALILSAALSRAGHRSQTASSNGVPQHHPTRVLIIGATGGTGRQLVTQALERGYAVTALVRDPSRLQTVHPQLVVMKGDVLDEGSVEAAMRGQDAVICALGHKRFFYPTRILSDGTQNILRAMETHSVARLVCQTSLGIGDSAGRMGLYYTLFVIPVILPFYFWDKTRQERMITGSNVEWVIVRPGLLTNGDKQDRTRHGLHVGSFLWTVRISRADVADFMLNQLTSDTYLRTAPGVSW
jgi:putative NADH-flavin reductase